MNDLTKKVIDFETRKSIHTNLTRAAHTEFRKVLFGYSLSMQEVFERFATLVGENDPTAMLIIQETYQAKRDKILKVTRREAENLYDAISKVDPFEEQD